MVDNLQSALFHTHARGNWVRLRTLVLLRWLAIGGQVAAVLISTQLLGIGLPSAFCAVVISASVSVNLVAQLAHPPEKRLSERGTLMSQVFDLTQLVVMLMLTGGLNNPFALLIIAPVTIAAAALRLTSTLILGGGAILSVPLMNFFYLPLVGPDGAELVLPEPLRHGFGAALIIGLVFLSLYARRVTVEGFTMSEALNATQMALAREQRLAALGGMAAAAAHELGTPLATIKLVAGELADEIPDRPDLAADVELIREEAQRCGEIMADLARGGGDDSHLKQAPVGAVIEEAAEPHANRGKEIVVRVDGGSAASAGDAQPTIRRSPELIHGLRNAIQNAVDFAAGTVWIDAELQDGVLRIAVGDDGPGFSPEILPRLGEPYVSSRGGRGSATGGRDGYRGMGLGLFIARTLLERTGAEISFVNGSDGKRRIALRADAPSAAQRPPGAIIEMLWPEERVVVPRDQSRRALDPDARLAD